jgi:hypothetical protein
MASVVCALVLALSAVTECAGWQATEEARMDCCAEGLCPLHGHGQEPSGTQLTQAAADSCCALSALPQSAPSATVFASTITQAVLQTLPPPVTLTSTPTMPIAAPWETPSPPQHVPTHLLLSVLLV